MSCLFIAIYRYILSKSQGNPRAVLLTSTEDLLSITCCLDRTIKSICFDRSSYVVTWLSKPCHLPSKFSHSCANLVSVSRRDSNPETRELHCSETSPVCSWIFCLFPASACWDISAARSSNKSNSSCWFCQQ